MNGNAMMYVYPEMNHAKENAILVTFIAMARVWTKTKLRFGNAMTNAFLGMSHVKINAII